MRQPLVLLDIKTYYKVMIIKEDDVSIKIYTQTK